MASKVVPLIKGNRVLLRDRILADVDRFIYWQTHGEWTKLDAPWEGIGETLTPEEEENIRAKFLERCQAEQPAPRLSAFIVLKDGMRPLGWVNTYGQKRFSQVIRVGIDICEDNALNRGIGTEALTLWINYIFTHRECHKIALDTWSFNPRMMHVAEKVGFTLEGAERELIEWEGVWHDLMHFGMLRREWEKTPSNSPINRGESDQSPRGGGI